MYSVYKREFRAFFQSVIGWLFIAANLFVLGLYFTVYNIISAYPYVSYALSGGIFLFIFSIPLLTMRVLSEERKQKTDQLIFTAPISLGKIVMGKFLSMVSVFAITVAVACVYPLVLTFFGTIDFAESYTAILGYFLYGVACIAIGTFISSLTESIVIAAVGSFAAMFITYMMSGITDMISSDGNVFTYILGAFDMRTPCTNMMNGAFDLTAVIYYVSIIFIFLFLTVQSIQKRRWEITKTNRATGLFSTAFVAIAIAICVVVNFAINLLPETMTSYDVTSQKLYSLTDDTKEYLSTIDEEVTIYVLGSKGDDSLLDRTLARYEANCSNITVEYKNTTTYPTFYQTYTDEAPTDDSLIVVCGDNYRIVDYSDVYEYELDYTTYSYETTGYDGEGLITSAIQYVVEGTTSKVYVVTGQDEEDIGDTFYDALSKLNADYEEITLLSYDEVPEDCDCLIINAPSSDFSEEDAAKIIEYLENGGSALIVTGYTSEDMPNFESILAAYGMGTTGGLVVDTDSGYYIQQTPYYTISTVESTEVSSSVSGEYIFLPLATGLTISDDTDDLTTTVLAYTSSSAVVKMDPENMTSYSVDSDAGDLEGQQILAAWAELTVESTDASGDASGDSSGDADTTTTSNLIVVSSASFLDDSADSIVSGNNLDLFSDFISAMISDEDSSSISIAVKEYSVDYLTITSRMAIVVSMAFTVILPIVLIIIGIVIWVRRRKR